MKLSAYPSAVKRSGGFTLIELLIVIGIIAVLAAMLFPVLGVMQARSHKIQAINDMRNIKTSIISYYSDYRKYPINATQASAANSANGGHDTLYGDPGGLYTNANLFNILRAIEDDRNPGNSLNPNNTVYWEGQMVKDRKNPRSGLTFDDAANGGIKAGTFVDPWGNPYLIWIDANNDGDMSEILNESYSDVSATYGTIHAGLPPMGMEFGSLGADGKWGTQGNHVLGGSDDVVTW